MPIFFFFLRSKGFCVYSERTVLLSQMFSLAALPQGNCRHCSGRKPPTATWLLSCVTAGIWQDGEISVGRHFCLSCTLPVSIRSVLVISLLSVSLVADKEFSRIMAPSKRHFSTWALGKRELIFANFLYPAAVVLLGLGNIPAENTHPHPSRPFKWQNVAHSHVFLTKERSAEVENSEFAGVGSK